MSSYSTVPGAFSPLRVAELCAGIFGIVIFWRKYHEVENLHRALHDAEAQALANSNIESAAIASQASKISQLHSKIATLSSTYEGARQQLVSDLNASQLEVNRQSGMITSLRQKLQLALVDVQAKNKIAETLQAEVENLKREDESRHPDNRHLASECESPQMEAHYQCGFIDSLEKKLNQALADVQEKTRLVTELETELNVARKQEASHLRVVSELELVRSEMARQSQLITSLRQELDCAREDILSRTEIAGSLEKELAAARNETSFHTQVVSFQSEFGRQSDLIDSLRGDLALALSNLREQTAVANEWGLEVERLRIEEESNRDLASQLEESQLEVGRQSASIASLHQDLERALANSNAKAQIAIDLGKELETVKENAEELKTRLTSELESSRTEIAHQSTLAETLRLDLEQARLDGQDKVEELAKVKYEHLQLRDEFVVLREQAKSRERELEGLEHVREELGRVSTELDEMRESARSAEESKLLVEAKIEQIESQKRSVEEELEKKTKDAENKTKDEMIVRLEREVKRLTDAERERLSSIRTLVDGDSDTGSLTSSLYTAVDLSAGIVGGVDGGGSLSASAKRLTSPGQPSTESLRTHYSGRNDGIISRVVRAFDTAIHLGKHDNHEDEHSHGHKSQNSYEHHHHSREHKSGIDTHGSGKGQGKDAGKGNLTERGMYRKEEEMKEKEGKLKKGRKSDNLTSHVTWS